MNIKFREDVLKSFQGCRKISKLEEIQQVWSGYGTIVKYEVAGAELENVVVKHIYFPNQSSHPRGWNTNLSDQRKRKSYQVEIAWYKQYSRFCNTFCRVPKCLAIESSGDEIVIVLEDLEASGFHPKDSQLNWEDIKSCIEWLANFHAIFLHKKTENLWQTGTYWHLGTRPDELNVLDDRKLKQAAPIIDDILNRSPYQTFVHGDAKLANFCFAKGSPAVAAVDFQYVGGGIGMKDLAYFIGSCLYEEDCEQMEEKLLDTYFAAFKQAIRWNAIKVDANAIEANWRKLYPFAWTDFHRFLKGWSPGHWKINSYSEKLSREVISEINKN